MSPSLKILVWVALLWRVSVAYNHKYLLNFKYYAVRTKLAFILNIAVRIKNSSLESNDLPKQYPLQGEV